MHLKNIIITLGINLDWINGRNITHISDKLKERKSFYLVWYRQTDHSRYMNCDKNGWYSINKNVNLYVYSTQILR